MSDSLLSSLFIWFQWITIVSLGLGFLSAIGLFFVNSELSNRRDNIIDDTKLEIVETKKTVENTKLDVVEVKKTVKIVKDKQKPRTISKIQKTLLSSGLISVTDKNTIAVVYTAGDKESELFAKQISTIFTNSNIKHLLTPWIGTPIQSGLSILSRSKDSDINAYTISRIFFRINFDNKYMRGSFIPDNEICILVGAKE